MIDQLRSENNSATDLTGLTQELQSNYWNFWRLYGDNPQLINRLIFLEVEKFRHEVEPSPATRDNLAVASFIALRYSGELEPVSGDMAA